MHTFKAKKVAEALRKAGSDLVKRGRMPKSPLEVIGQPLISEEEYARAPPAGDLVITLTDPKPLETPEFPLLIILPISMIAPLLAVIVCRRRLKKGNLSAQIRNFSKRTFAICTFYLALFCARLCSKT